MLRKLAGQTMIYGVSSIVARLLNYLLTPYLTRIMQTAEYGVMSYFYSLIPFALVVLTMGMESGYFRFAGQAKSVEDKRKVFATTWGAVTSAAIGFMALVLLFRNPLAGMLECAMHPDYIWLVGAIIMLDVITAIPFARLREEGRAIRYVIVRLVSVVVNVAGCLACFELLPRVAAHGGWLASLYNPSYSVGYVLVSNLIASFVALLLLLPSSCDVAPRIDRRLFRQIFAYSLPLLVSGIAGTANEFIDRQMIMFLMPPEEAASAVGIYSAVVKIAMVLMLFTQMYRMAAEPFFLASFRKEDFARSNAEALKYFIIVSGWIFLAIALFPQLFALIVGADFRVGIYILPVVLLANVCSGIVLNLSFWYKQIGQTKFAIWITGAGLAVTVVMNLWLVPRLGYYGAAIARLICEATMVAVSYWLCRRYFPIPYDLRRIGEYALVVAILYGVGTIGGEWLPAFAKYSLNSLLVIGFAGYAVRRERIDLRGLVHSVLHRGK